MIGPFDAFHLLNSRPSVILSGAKDRRTYAGVASAALARLPDPSLRSQSDALSGHIDQQPPYNRITPARAPAATASARVDTPSL